MYYCFGILKLSIFFFIIIFLYLCNQYKKNRKFVYISVFILLLKILYILLYHLYEQGLSPDESRYLYEILQISINPLKWNPFTGQGVNYSVTPKMGMSYIYGVILFLFQAPSYISIMILNVIVAYFTCVAVYKLTLVVIESKKTSLLAMFITAIYPEILFWNARVLRENLTLLLVTYLVFLSIKLFEGYKMKYLILLIFTCIITLITRAQLVMFLPLIFFYYIIIYRKLNKKSILILLFTIFTFIYSIPFIKLQMTRAIGKSFLKYFTLDPRFWTTQILQSLSNILSVLSFTTKSGYGMKGLMILPFTILSMLFLILAVFNYQKIFKGKTKKLGLLFFLYMSFIIMLAINGSVSIRYRATVSPLIMPIVAHTFRYFAVNVKKYVIKY